MGSGHALILLGIGYGTLGVIMTLPKVHGVLVRRLERFGEWLAPGSEMHIWGRNAKQLRLGYLAVAALLVAAGCVALALGR